MATKPKTKAKAPEAKPEAEASTDLVPVETTVSAELAATRERLDALTIEARKAITVGRESFQKAAKLLTTIRDENLVADADLGVDFAEYCEQQFGISRDYGDKYIRAGKVFDRIRRDLTTRQIAAVGLPQNEGQLRPLGRLLGTDPDDKLVGKVWNEASKAAKKARKGITVTPSVKEVVAAIEKLAPKPEAPKPEPKPEPQPEVIEGEAVEVIDANDPLNKKLLDLIDSYSDVVPQTLLAILLDGMALGNGYTRGVVREAFDAIMAAKAAK